MAQNCIGGEVEEILTGAGGKLLEYGIAITVLVLNIAMLMLAIRYLVKRNESLTDQFIVVTRENIEAFRSLRESIDAFTRSKIS